jgi:type IV secretory pathway VirB6-like protein
MATVIMSFISLKLVLFLAPVMVPFIMFKPMTWLFDSWLKFLLGACMMKIVLAFMLLAAQAILGAMALVQAEMAAAAANVDPTAAAVADLFVHAMMMIFALLSTLLLMQVPAIATGLLSGGAGGTGFGGIKGLTQSPSARTANDTGEFAAKKGWSGVKKGAGAGEGAYSGYKAGRSLSHSDPGDRKGGQRDAYEAMYNRARAGTHGPMVPKGR